MDNAASIERKRTEKTLESGRLRMSLIVADCLVATMISVRMVLFTLEHIPPVSKLFGPMQRSTKPKASQLQMAT